MVVAARWGVGDDGESGPDVVLHLGAHKTGTTSLQRALRNSADELSEAGWVFQGKRVGPLSDVFSAVHDMGARGERSDTASPPDEAVAERLRDEVAAIIGSGRRIIISDETLFGQPGVRRGLYPDADRVARVVGIALQGRTVLPVLVIRRQPEFLESWYVQTVKQGAGWSFDEYLESIDLSRVSWAAYARRIAGWLGVEPLLVAYEWLVRRDDGLIGWFFEHLGATRSADRDDLDLNSGFSEAALMVALAAHPHLDRDQRAALRRFLERNVSEPSAPRPRLLSDAGRRRIVEALAADNASCFDSGVVADGAVTARYLGSDHGDDPAPEAPDASESLHHPRWPGVREALRVWIDASVDGVSSGTPT